jgi:apolipoprotein N-acyltransferase
MNEVLRKSDLRNPQIMSLTPNKSRSSCFYFSLSFLSGIFLILSFPKFGRGFVAWVALVPLLCALTEIRKLSKAFLIGFLTGFVYHVGVFYWIANVVVNYGNLPLYAGISALLLLSFYLSIYTAAFSAGVVYFKEKQIPAFFSAPALWVILEYAKSHLLTGFPWENLSYSQYMNLPFIQIADITGTYGISFIIVMVNVIINDLPLITTGHDKKRVMTEIAIGSLIILTTYSYGIFKINHINNSILSAESMKVSIIQANIPPDIKWDPHYQRETINLYKKLSLSCNIFNQSLIVWPETATPFYFQDKNLMQEAVLNVAKEARSWLLFGSPSYIKNQNGLSFMNSAFLLSPNGNLNGKYDKVHLVPYGEYVPLRTLLPFIGKMVPGVGDFAKGEGLQPLTINHHKLGVLICYEGIFPELSRSYKEKGADLLINLTNDAWFGKTSAPYQHLSMTVFRAIENRLFIVRAANTGISAIIDSTGNILKRTNLYEETSLSGTVKHMYFKTFYMKYGDVFSYICILMTLYFVIISRRRKRNV